MAENLAEALAEIDANMPKDAMEALEEIEAQYDDSDAALDNEEDRAAFDAFIVRRGLDRYFDLAELDALWAALVARQMNPNRISRKDLTQAKYLTKQNFLQKQPIICLMAVQFPYLQT